MSGPIRLKLKKSSKDEPDRTKEPGKNSKKEKSKNKKKSGQIQEPRKDIGGQNVIEEVKKNKKTLLLKQAPPDLPIMFHDLLQPVARTKYRKLQHKCRSCGHLEATSSALSTHIKAHSFPLYATVPLTSESTPDEHSTPHK